MSMESDNFINLEMALYSLLDDTYTFEDFSLGAVIEAIELNYNLYKYSANSRVLYSTICLGIIYLSKGYFYHEYFNRLLNNIEEYYNLSDAVEAIKNGNHTKGSIKRAIVAMIYILLMEEDNDQY